MMMNQNSSDYSENNSAGVQLDPAIQKLIAPDVKGNTEVKFDGYGTLHVLERGDDGKLLSDSYLAKQEDKNVSIVDDYTNMEKLEYYTKKNAKLRVLLKLQKVAIIIFVIFFFFLFVLLKLTLQRIM